MSRKDYIVQANMSLQLANIFLPLLFHLCLRVGAAENTAVVFDVNQTPPCIRAMEGSEFTIECTFNTDNNSVKWFAAWSKTRNNVTEEVCHRADRIILSADKEERSLSLTVKKADVTDSGTYVCGVGNKNVISPGNGTEVTIDEITDLLVNQTPTNFSDLEGSELTMNCTFKTVNNHSTMRVRWYNYGTEGLKKELVNENDVITTLHLDNGFASLTLKNANSSNTGTYICEVGITARNLYNNGSGTQVTIENFPELTVNQTPGNIDVCEGSDLTVECRFMVLKKHNTLYVKWYKHNGTGGTKKELMSESGWDSAVLALEKGFVSFALKNVNVTDTGTYLCEVGSTARNWSASGAGTQVTITHFPKLTVNQTPGNIDASEGSDLTMECRFTVLKKHNTLYVKWYKHNGTGGTKKELMSERGWGSAAQALEEGFVSFALKNVNVTDTGTYVCEVGSTARNWSASGAGTQVTITPVDLLVNQTPAVMNGLEGKKLTVECRFKVVKDSSTMYSVTWYKKGADGHENKLKNGTGIVTTVLDSSKGLASLTLIKINRNDSGLYRCDFGKNGVGNGTRVTIQARAQWLMSSYIVAAAAAGTILFLLVLGILLWRWRQCSKVTQRSSENYQLGHNFIFFPEPLQSRSEAEMTQMETSSPPPADEVTYVDLNFHKRDTKAEEEVVYTEVKIRPKQRDDNVIYAKVNPHHH
ncbi:polymeric immunoglobulin receptor isoform X5 [Chelonia mydas]|uniref:polymeric immunoglobulin receptor isoform X5 n=1 Tax=Chelonia mydas TaxID=8469 RepID=UPI001CA7D816|nr:polymeric immunoglobulin receptor isoform X5 [Chelonia mydas]